MADLHLNLKEIHWNEIKAGTKTHEFRLCKPHWKKRIEGKNFDNVQVKLAFPKADNHAAILIRPWRGYDIRTIQHDEFGPDPVLVYAIRVN